MEVQQRPPIDTDPAWTKGELEEFAAKLLGRGALSRKELNRNHSILTAWDGIGRSREEQHAAIEGLRMLADEGAVGWLKPGDVIGLRALNHTGTLFDQGDGKVARPLFDVAVERAYREASTVARSPVRGGGPKAVGGLVDSTVKRLGGAA